MSTVINVNVQLRDAAGFRRLARERIRESEPNRNKITVYGGISQWAHGSVWWQRQRNQRIPVNFIHPKKAHTLTKPPAIPILKCVLWPHTLDSHNIATHEHVECGSHLFVIRPQSQNQF